MTDAERGKAVVKHGFTPRQAAFLVTVTLHAGVCLMRQYCTFARLAFGQSTRDFFKQLVERGFATPCPCARQTAHLYHVQHKALYRAIGEPNSRLRRPVPMARAVERLMLLDAVLADPQLAWLATERDKLAHFERCTRWISEDMPRLVCRGTKDATPRYFPDRFPIGYHADGRAHVFLYLVRSWDPFHFRTFLQRHAELLRGLPEWRLRLLIPPHMRGAEDQYLSACWNEFATPLRPDAVDELRWYFQRRREASRVPIDPGEDRYRRAHRAFSSTRYRALYRHWAVVGDRLLDAQGSHLLGDALKRQIGKVDCHVLKRQYSHLSPLVGTV
jgi:hypothetical protein